MLPYKWNVLKAETTTIVRAAKWFQYYKIYGKYNPIFGQP